MMYTRWIFLSAFGLMVMMSKPVLAHHGREFLILSTSELPHPGQIYFLLSTDVLRMKERTEDAAHDAHPVPSEERLTEMEWEPGVFIGITHYWSVEFHSHVEREGGSSRYASTAVENRLDLNRFLPGIPLKTGLLLEYEQGHRGHDSHIEGRLLLAKEMGGILTAVNFGVERTVGEDTEVLYGIGLKRQILPGVSVGVEYLGQRLSDFQGQIIPGLYVNIRGHLNFKVGGAMSVSDPSNTAGVRTALIVGF